MLGLGLGFRGFGVLGLGLTVSQQECREVWCLCDIAAFAVLLVACESYLSGADGCEVPHYDYRKMHAKLYSNRYGPCIQNSGDF